MKNIDRKHNEPSEDEFDRILDAALAKYASAEPRTGLEERILAFLHSSEIPVSHSAWSRWGLAVALAAVLIALVISLRSIQPNSEVGRHQTPVQLRSSDDKLHGLGPDVDVPNHQAPIDISVASTIRIRRKPKVPKNPKLDVFPSPHPLSEQEEMLARYVAQFNDEAVIVARVRSEGMRVDREKEMQEVERSGNQDPQAR